jgi:hypothetical protein
MGPRWRSWVRTMLRSRWRRLSTIEVTPSVDDPNLVVLTIKTGGGTVQTAITRPDARRLARQLRRPGHRTVERRPTSVLLPQDLSRWAPAALISYLTAHHVNVRLIDAATGAPLSEREITEQATVDGTDPAPEQYVYAGGTVTVLIGRPAQDAARTTAG